MRKTVFILILTCLPTAAMAQMGAIGPSVLSRISGGSTSGGGNEFVTIRPYLTITGTYTDGLTPASLDPQGRIQDDSSYGVTGTFGAYGYHRWQRRLLGLSYQGRARHYWGRQNRDGIDQILTLGYEHQFASRTALVITQSAGIYSQGDGLHGLSRTAGIGFNFPGNLNTPLIGAGVSDVDLIDTRTYFGVSQIGITHQMSNRLSVSASANGMLVRRTEPDLAGVNGYGGTGTIMYRLSRRQSVGAAYTNNHYDYTGAFGQSTVQMMLGQYSRMLGRYWDFDAAAGIYRLGTVRTTQVNLDPNMAALLGRRTAVEVFRGTNYGLGGRATLTRTFARSSMVFGYNRFISPGNGVYLASQVESGFIGFSYRGIRDWGFGLTGSFNRYSPRTQQQPPYYGVAASASVSRRILDWLHFSSSLAVSRRHIPNGFTRDRLTVAVGFSFAPGETPLSFW